MGAFARNACYTAGVTGVALYQAALAIAFGMAGQAIAVRFAFPGIVLLLATGVVIGPDMLGWLDPSALGSARTDLVGLAVTIILFEGGLGLRLEDLRQHQRPLTMLLTVGGLISMAAGTLASYYILGLRWNTAALYGALMIVTGPTVVTPLLARLSMDRRVRELLISEGVLIDPIGAIVAIVGLEYVLGNQGVLEMGWLVLGRLALGGAIGAAAAVAMTYVLRKQWVREDLWNPVVLASVLLAATLASRLSGEAGLMTAVTEGVVMANTGLREMRRLRQFNEEMTVVLLSFIFVLLAADLPLSKVWALGWGALGVVAILVWVARPLSIFICTAGTEMTTRERLFLSWVCPRGIVAVSVAGLFRILLESAQIPGGDRLEPLVFVTVGLTVTVQGLTIGPVARLLRVDVPSLQGTMIVGADLFGRMLARLLTAFERQVVLIDRSGLLCRAAQSEGLSVYNGDALSVDAMEEAGARYVDTVLAATVNAELNTLIAERVRNNFRVERILSVVEEATQQAAESHPHPFPGNFPGPDETNRLLRAGRLNIVEYEIPAAENGTRLNDLPYGDGEFAVFLHRRDRIFVASSDQTMSGGDRLLCAVTVQGGSPLAARLHKLCEIDPRQLPLPAPRPST